MTTFSFLTPDQIETLKFSIGEKEAAEEEARIEAARVPCRFRGCSKDGVFYLKRLLKEGGIQQGYFCDSHEERFGEQNLRRWARETNSVVATFKDDAGEFRGVL